MSDWNVSEEAVALHADSLVWDMTFPYIDYGNAALKWSALERMQANGFNMVSLTVGGDSFPLTEAVQSIAKERAWFRANDDNCIRKDSDAQKFRLVINIHLIISFAAVYSYCIRIHSVHRRKTTKRF